MKIFLISGKAESGKDTFYELARRYIGKNYNTTIAHIAFANAVKECARDMGWNGVKDENGRSGLIMVGDGARKWFDPDIWIKKVIDELDTQNANSPCENRSFTEDLVFITDCRYPNEITMLKDWAEINGVEAYAIRIVRTNHISKLTPEQLQNPSEIALDDFAPWDYIVENEGSIDFYMENIMIVIDDILGEG